MVAFRKARPCLYTAGGAVFESGLVVFFEYDYNKGGGALLLKRRQIVWPDFLDDYFHFINIYKKYFH